MIKDKYSPDTARDVGKRNKRGRRALVANSMKNGVTEVRFESGLEKEFGLLLEADARVKSYKAQPFTLELESNTIIDTKESFKISPGEEPRFYTPDFSCDLSNDMQCVVEVKHEQFIKKFGKKKEHIEACLGKHGKGFMLVTNQMLSPELIANINCIHGYRAGYLTEFRENNRKEIEVFLGIKSKWLVMELASFLSAGISAVITGLINGQLTTNLRDSLFTPQSVVYAGGGDLSHFSILEFE